MADVLTLKTFSDSRGCLSVLEKTLPFDIRRVFFLYDVRSERGGHGHLKTQLAMVCLGGQVTVEIDNGLVVTEVVLDKTDKCLLLAPSDWHLLKKFSAGANIVVFASEEYDPEDYFYERPSRVRS